MRTRFLSLLSVVVSAASPYGQSPAPAVPKASVAESSTLTKEETDRAVEYLRETQKEFLAAIADL